MKGSISKPHLNLRYEHTDELNKYEEQSLNTHEILQLLDLEDTGYIDLENLVISTQKMLLQRIPPRHKTTVDSILRNYVFDFRSFQMPSDIFVRLYEQERSKVITENTRRCMRNRIKSLSMIQSEFKSYDLPTTVNTTSSKHLFTPSICMNRNIGTSTNQCKPRQISHRLTRSSVKNESFLSKNPAKENERSSKSPSLYRSYTGLYESRKKIERKIEIKDRQIYTSIYRCMDKYGPKTPAKNFIHSFLKNSS